MNASRERKQEFPEIENGSRVDQSRRWSMFRQSTSLNSTRRSLQLRSRRLAWLRRPCLQLPASGVKIENEFAPPPLTKARSCPSKRSRRCCGSCLTMLLPNDRHHQTVAGYSIALIEREMHHRAGSSICDRRAR